MLPSGAAMAYGPVDGPTRLVVAFAFGLSVLVTRSYQT